MFHRSVPVFLVALGVGCGGATELNGANSDGGGNGGNGAGGTGPTTNGSTTADTSTGGVATMWSVGPARNLASPCASTTAASGTS